MPSAYEPCTSVNGERIEDTITKTHLDILQLAIGINIDCLVLGGIIDKVGTHDKESPWHDI